MNTTGKESSNSVTPEFLGFEFKESQNSPNSDWLEVNGQAYKLTVQAMEVAAGSLTDTDIVQNEWCTVYTGQSHLKEGDILIEIHLSYGIFQILTDGRAQVVGKRFPFAKVYECDREVLYEGDWSWNMDYSTFVGVCSGALQ